MTGVDRHAAARAQQYIDEASRSATDGNEYQGLQIHAWRGLHDFLGGKLPSIAPRGGRVLDLAAGTGAMSLRLHDAGFEVTASDIVRENFRLHDRIAFTTLDLNKPFGTVPGAPYDLIMAVELIEHLENPRHFLRECRTILKPGGALLITTPNVNSPVSKAMLVRFGTLAWFTEKDYDIRGHIMPVSRLMLSQCARETGYAIESLETFGDPYDDVVGWPKMRWLAKLMQGLSGEPRELQNAVLVSVLRRTD